MNRRTDKEELLDTVIAGERDDFRESSLAGLLQSARRRRRARVARRAGGAVFALGAIMAAIWLWMFPQKPQVELANRNPEPATYDLVTSVSLSPGQIVTTRPLSPAQIVSSSLEIHIVHTFHESIREVGDEELLALALPRVAALVRRGPNEAELVFVPEVSDPNQH
jgi:hypothetical protein